MQRKPESNAPRGARLCLVAILCASGAGAAAAAPGASERSGPRAEVSRPSLHAGQTGRGSVVELVFDVRNRGDEVLELLEVIPACDCTIVDYDDAIPPAGIGRIRARLDTEGYLGHLQRRIDVLTNDPSASNLVLWISADVVASVEVVPAGELLLRTVPGRPAMGRRLIRKDPTEDGRLEVRDPRASLEWVHARATELREDRPPVGGLPAARAGDWELEVWVDGEVDFGRQMASVSFSTGLPREPVVTLPVVVDLRAPVNVPSKRLVLRPGPDGRGRAVVPLSVRVGLDPGELRVAAEPAGLQAVLEPSGERLFRVVVEWAPAGPAPTGAITFSVGGERLRMPVDWKP